MMKDIIILIPKENIENTFNNLCQILKEYLNNSIKFIQNLPIKIIS